MKNEELLQKIAELEKKLQETENELADEKAKHYKTNEKLNEVLLKLSIYQEKYGIERIKQIIPKNEKIEKIVINEIEEVKKETKGERKTNKGKRYKKSNFDYERNVSEIRYIEPEETHCRECGNELVVATEKIRYVVEVIPSKIKVIKLIKRTKKCKGCNKKDNKAYYPLSKEVFDGSILTPSLAAFLMYYKYELGIPFNHLAGHISKSIGYEITKQNIANYMAKASEKLEPIYNQMRKDLLMNEEGILHSDETTLVVSKKDEENKDRKKSYVYVYASSYYSGNQIRIYDFQENRKIDQTAKWLKEFKGIIHCDDYSGYDTLKKSNENIKLQRCWAHVRRRFSDIVKSLDSKSKKTSVAYRVLNEISKLFELEAKYKKQNKNPIEILKSRKQDMPIVIESIKRIIFDSKPIKGSSLENAINYVKKCWPDLFEFMENGYVELTNNLCERAVKPFVIQRKVFQTSGSYAGARYTTKLFSIIQTCKINNINIEKYIEYVLNNITKIDIEDLTPYSKNIQNKIK